MGWALRQVSSSSKKFFFAASWLRSETRNLVFQATASDYLYLLSLLQVFERRATPKARPVVGDTRAYLVALNKKGTDALKLAKVDLMPLIPAHNGRVGEAFALAYLSVAHSVKTAAGAQSVQRHSQESRRAAGCSTVCTLCACVAQYIYHISSLKLYVYLPRN